MKGDIGFLYDSLEATDAVVEALNILKLNTEAEEAEAERLRQLLAAELAACRGDSVWLDVERLMAECLAPRTPVNEALRFYFNRLAASEERAFRRERWDELAKQGWRPEPGTLQTLGFDGSVNDDWTALIATDFERGTQWVVGIWEPRQDDRGEWRIDVDGVNTAVEEVMTRYDVWRMNADPFYWMEHIGRWAAKYNRPGRDVVVSFPTTNLKPTALAVLAYRNAIETGEVTNDGDARMSWAIGNCHKRMLPLRDDKGEPLFVLQKERPMSPLKIDPAMAGVISYWAHLAAVAAAKYYIDYSDFSVWVLRVHRVRWVGGYGRMDSATGADFVAAQPDPIRPLAAGAIAHLNADHAESLAQMARALGGYPDAAGAVCTSIDRYGLDLRVDTPRGGAYTRVGFGAPLTSADELRSAAADLAARARGG